MGLADFKVYVEKLKNFTFKGMDKETYRMIFYMLTLVIFVLGGVYTIDDHDGDFLPDYTLHGVYPRDTNVASDHEASRL